MGKKRLPVELVDLLNSGNAVVTFDGVTYKLQPKKPPVTTKTFPAICTLIGQGELNGKRAFIKHDFNRTFLESFCGRVARHFMGEKICADVGGIYNGNEEKANEFSGGCCSLEVKGFSTVEDFFKSKGNKKIIDKLSKHSTFREQMYRMLAMQYFLLGNGDMHKHNLGFVVNKNVPIGTTNRTGTRVLPAYVDYGRGFYKKIVKGFKLAKSRFYHSDRLAISPEIIRTFPIVDSKSNPFHFPTIYRTFRSKNSYTKEQVDFFSKMQPDIQYRNKCFLEMILLPPDIVNQFTVNIPEGINELPTRNDYVDALYFQIIALRASLMSTSSFIDDVLENGSQYIMDICTDNPNYTREHTVFMFKEYDNLKKELEDIKGERKEITDEEDGTFVMLDNSPFDINDYEGWSVIDKFPDPNTDTGLEQQFRPERSLSTVNSLLDKANLDDDLVSNPEIEGVLEYEIDGFLDYLTGKITDMRNSTLSLNDVENSLHKLMKLIHLYKKENKNIGSTIFYNHENYIVGRLEEINQLKTSEKKDSTQFIQEMTQKLEGLQQHINDHAVNDERQQEIKIVIEPKWLIAELRECNNEVERNADMVQSLGENGVNQIEQFQTQIDHMGKELENLMKNQIARTNNSRNELNVFRAEQQEIKNTKK